MQTQNRPKQYLESWGKNRKNYLQNGAQRNKEIKLV